MHWLDPVRIRASSEGSMLLMVEFSLKTEQRQRGGEVRGKRERVGKGDGGGSGCFVRGKEGIQRCNLEGGGRGCQVMWGRVM